MNYSLSASIGGVLLAALGAVALAGCADSGGVEPQETLTSHRTGSVHIHWPHRRWWRAYGDPQLDQLIVRATADNPDLHLAQARLRLAQAQAGIASAGTEPDVSADADFQRVRFTEQQFIPPPFAGNWYWNNLANFDFSWDLDLWGGRRNHADAALGRAAASAVDTREATLTLQTALVQTYVRLWANDALAALARSDLQRQQRLLDIARQRHAAGLGSQLQVDEATTALPNTRARLESLADAGQRLRHQLALLAGRPPSYGESLQPPMLRSPAQALPDELPADLLGHRPDVVAARLRVEAAGHDIKAAKAQFYPDVNLTAFAGFQALSFAQLFTGSAAQAGVGPAISLPIFAGGRLRNGLRAADAGYDAAVDDYHARVLQALQQTADALDTLHSLSRQSRQVDAAQAAARRAYTQAQRGYNAGLTNETAALQAQQSLLAQERRHAQLAARQLSTYAALMQALGGGYDDSPGDQRDGAAAGAVGDGESHR